MLQANTRFPSNCCERCEYDLTGNVSGICPECGTAIPDETKAALKRQIDDRKA
jgi:predicted amidophosphoribosyltransferase